MSNFRLRRCSGVQLPDDLVVDEILSKLPLLTRSICRCVCKRWWCSLAFDPILVDILSRLPVKSLLRFRSVSKLWRSIIDDPHFIRVHHGCGILRRTTPAFLFSHGLGGSVIALDRNGVAVPIPIIQVPKSVSILQSCNGLTMVAGGDFDILLCNPSTRRFTVLPPARRVEKLGGQSWFHDSFFGLGYDPGSNKFKVVHLLYVPSVSGQFQMGDEERCDLECEVFTLGSSSWRRIGRVPFSLRGCRTPAYAGGVIYWRNFFEESADKIMAFNVADELFQLIPHPLSMDNVENCDLRLTPTNDRLCVSAFTYDCHERAVMLIWILEDPLNNVWVKDCVLLPDERLVDLEPLGFCDGEVLMELEHCLFYYNLNNKSFRRLQVTGYDCRILHITGYMDSLMPLQ